MKSIQFRLHVKESVHSHVPFAISLCIVLVSYCQTPNHRILNILCHVSLRVPCGYNSFVLLNELHLTIQQQVLLVIELVIPALKYSYYLNNYICKGFEFVIDVIMWTNIVPQIYYSVHYYKPLYIYSSGQLIRNKFNFFNIVKNYKAIKSI